MDSERVTINGKSYVKQDELKPWLDRKDQALADRKEYLPQIKINRCFAAGKQHLDVNNRDGRVVEVRKRNGVELVQSNLLDQYLNTAVGTLSSSDYKSNFLSVQDDALTEDIVVQMNKSYSWGWDHEWSGDNRVQSLWRYLSVDGTVAVRVRYDRRFGEIVGDVPYKDGVPILDKDEAAKFVAEKAERGETAKIDTLREGKCVLEVIMAEGLLPPPGYEDPATFPWDLICRPVTIAELKNRYGKLAEDIQEEEIESPGALTANFGTKDPEKLQNRAMVYTGFQRPNNQYKKGRMVVFTETALLDIRESLDYADHPAGPRSGLHYFRWGVLPGRFWGKAFIENGIGPQKVFNKRLTQINAIIDRNMPKVFIEEQSLSRPRTGEPFEIIEVRPGAPLPNVQAGIAPGQWMLDDLKLQAENVEKAMGLRGVSMGTAPQGVAAYSAMALLTENDAKKLDPVAQDFRREMNEVSYDLMEAMRNWPRGKHILLGGPDNHVQSFEFNASKIPSEYLVRPPRGGSMPNSQAAEIQKVNDIWNAAGGALPLTWYVNSINAGKAQELPASLSDSDAHKAELENVIIRTTGEAPPVAPYDDDAKHVQIHRVAEAQDQMLADQGDQEAAARIPVWEEHIMAHEESAQGGAAGSPAAPSPTPTVPSPGMQTPGTGQAAPPPGPPAQQPGIGL